jgi:hypothetical protein
VAMAHEDHGGGGERAELRRQSRRISGTLNAVHDDRIEVKTKDGHVVGISLDEQTLYRRGKSRASSLALEVGAQVKVEAWSYGEAGVPVAKKITIDKAPEPAATPTEAPQEP